MKEVDHLSVSDVDKDQSIAVSNEEISSSSSDSSDSESSDSDSSSCSIAELKSPEIRRKTKEAISKLGSSTNDFEGSVAKILSLATRKSLILDDDYSSSSDEYNAYQNEALGELAKEHRRSSLEDPNSKNIDWEKVMESRVDEMLHPGEEKFSEDNESSSSDGSSSSDDDSVSRKEALAKLAELHRKSLFDKMSQNAKSSADSSEWIDEPVLASDDAPVLRKAEYGSTDDLEKLSKGFVIERAAVLEFYQNCEKPIDELPRESVLGEGQFGQVWLTSLKDGEMQANFALKVQDLTDAYKNESLENIYWEVKILKDLRHPFIVDLIDSKETDKESLMLMTLYTGGDLWGILHRKGADGKLQSLCLKEDEAKFYSLIIADTLVYIHSKNVLFRDLKPENVLLDAFGYPNIIDFGFAKVTTENTFTLIGTPNYMAPEIILTSGHHAGADHWALGIMIYEMISGGHPFYYEGVSDAELFDLVTKTEAFPCEKASKEVQAILDGLLEKDPTKRLGVLAGKERDILSHIWFEGLDLGKLRKREVKAPWVPPRSSIAHQS